MNTIQDFFETDDSWGISDYRIDGPIPKRVAREFISEYHYSGGCGNAIMAWGLYEQLNGQLVGVIAFQTPISENTRASIFEDISGPAGSETDVCDCDHIDEEHGYREHVTELHRLALHPDCPNNTGSWFISRGLQRLKDHKPKYWAVISMADTTEGHDGTVYQAANADYYGTSSSRVHYRDTEGVLRSARQVGENITQEEARDRGWEVERHSEKHRYVFWLPDPYQSKDDLRELSVIGLQEYPE